MIVVVIRSVGQLRAAKVLWACQHSAEREAAAVQSLRRSGLVQEGGVATTLVESGEQWGGPAAWLWSSTASRLQL